MQLTKKSIATLLFYFIVLSVPIFFASAEMPAIKNPTDSLQIKIPGLKFSDAQQCFANNGGKALCTNWIGEYISSIYNYGIAIAGIIAAVVMMFGGVIWLTAGGNASKVGEAKNWIGASITGLLLALTSYIIMQQINPDLIGSVSKPIALPYIDEYEGDSKARTISEADLTDLNINPGSLKGVVSSMLNNFTYSQEKRLTKDGNTSYIDCSSFVCTALKKSGANGPSPSSCNTTNIFSNARSTDTDLSKLPAGYLVGWPPSAAKNKSGHVYISLGDGTYAEARGGTEGRKTGNSIRIVQAKDVGSAVQRNTGSFPFVKSY
jgi:hypothetical protein